MRIALLVAALLAALPAHAAYIEGKLGLACRDLAYQKRIDAAAGAGDGDATTAIVQRGLNSGQCEALPNGLRVRIEENSWPYACVTRFGSAGPCQWVRQRYVNPRQ